MKFTVGDNLKAKATHPDRHRSWTPQYMAFLEGAIGTVKEIEGNIAYVTVEGHKGPCAVHLNDLQHIEIIPKEKPMPFKSMKFRVRNSKHSKVIQETLLAQGYTWTRGAVVQYQKKPYLYTGRDGVISYGDTKYHFEQVRTDVPEHLIEARTTYTVVEAPKPKQLPKPETVELNGKQYLKADLEAALAKLKPVKG